MRIISIKTGVKNDDVQLNFEGDVMTSKLIFRVFMSCFYFYVSESIYLLWVDVLSAKTF